MKQLHVLMVSEYFHPHGKGGGEMSALALAEALVGKGVKVSVLTSRFPKDKEKDSVNGVTIYRRLATGENTTSFAGNFSRLKLTPSITKELPKLIDEIKPDVVHALNITSMPGVAAVSRDIPSIAHINSPLAFCPKGTLLDHGKERTEPYTFLSFIWSFMGKDNGTEPAWYVRFNPVAWIVYYTRWAAIRDSFPSFTHFFPISTAMQRWLEKYGVAISKTTVLPNIVPVPATKEPKNKVLRLIYFGGYAPIKGLHILLDALKGVEESYELHCYGSGDNTQYQAQAKKNAITARFNGWTAEPDALKALEASDILVFPSLVPEGLGRVALVAMAAGKPVIASRIGGITDSIVDGKTGYLVEPGNVAAWRKAIRDLLSNKKRREAFGKAGRERFTAEFNKESILKKALAAYKTVSL